VVAERALADPSDTCRRQEVRFCVRPDASSPETAQLTGLCGLDRHDVLNSHTTYENRIFRKPNLLLPVPSCQFPVSSSQFPVSSSQFQFPVPSLQFPVSSETQSRFLLETGDWKLATTVLLLHPFAG
jgi:hypothetical protein